LKALTTWIIKSYIIECKYTRNEINIIELKELKQEKNAKHAARNRIMTSWALSNQP